ncbi:hypothetical protein QAD02_020946 [Eretmocerus hayati]|uniref:Uncharacterized protein n=1 Tax=Eretmocerus hayati TaxID=131215 RepID=A0ACC2PQ63_9HYME|nr:hypothetical protein QAD02_020946 [Eretmocerus hayati]
MLFLINIQNTSAYLLKNFYLMSQDKVRNKDCVTCQGDLEDYVARCQILYGQEYMNLNPHSASYIALSVKKGSPLWGSLIFSPESFMFQLQLNKTSPEGVGKQVVSRYSQKNHLRWTIQHNLDPNKKSTQFLESVLHKNQYARNGLNHLQLTSPRILNDRVVYDRCVHAGIIYTSIEYSQNSKKNDCVVQLDDDCIVPILYLDLKQGVCFFKAQKIANTKVQIGKVQLPHIEKLHCLYDHEYSFEMSRIEKKCVLMHVNDGGRYVAMLPNKLNNIEIICGQLSFESDI